MEKNTMEKKEPMKISMSTFFLWVSVVVIVVLCLYIGIQNSKSKKEISALESDKANLQSTVSNMQNEVNGLQSKIDEVSNIVGNNNSTKNTSESSSELIVLYEGEILLDGTAHGTPIKNESKYNTTYYNYENAKYVGETAGKLQDGVYEGSKKVSNVKKIAMSQKYNAIPRAYTKIEKLPQELIDMADYSKVEINAIDLDGDGKNEYVVCPIINYGEGDIGDGKPVAYSEIILFDSNYKKLENLISLDIQNMDYKTFLTLDDVEYIDIDNDGKMEILIYIPAYESGPQVSVIKYNNGKIEGDTNYKASVEP